MAKKSSSKKGTVSAPATETTPDLTTAPETVTAASVAPVKAGKFKGLGTVPGIPAGLRRMVFQDRLLEWNRTAKKTDLVLAALMDAEHPGGVKIRPDHMRAIRRLYNEGKHVKAGSVPAVPSVAYNEAGEALADVKGRRTRAA